MDNVQGQLLDAVRDYKMPQAAVELLAAHPPLILTGTSGAGKDAIEEYIQTTSDWRHVVTHTTRSIRPGETNGKDYWFVSEDEMLRLIREQVFIGVKFIHDRQVSGPSLAAYSAVLKSGHQPMLRIDVQGVEELQRHALANRPFFVLPPNFETWMERLDGRGHMSHIERVKRMRSAQKELEKAVNSDRFILVVNDEVPRVAKEVIGGVTDVPSQHRNRELAQRLIDHIKAF